MSLVNWITSNPDAAIAIIGGAVTYLWNKARGKKTDNLWDTATKLGHEALVSLLKDPNLYDDAYVRSKLTGAVWTGLARLGVKRTPALEKLVDEVVVHLKGELAEQLWKANLSKYIQVSETTAGTLREATSTPAT